MSAQPRPAPESWMPDDDAAAAAARRFAVALADELVGLTLKLGDLAYDLGSDERTLRRHMTSLQAIDLISQTQMALADLLRSDLPLADRLAEVTLEDLRTGLAARLAE